MLTVYVRAFFQARDMKRFFPWLSFRARFRHAYMEQEDNFIQELIDWHESQVKRLEELRR